MTRARSSRACSSGGWRRGTSIRRPPAIAGGELLDRDSAAERDRRAAHGPRPQRHHAGHRSRACGGCRAETPSGRLDGPRRDRDPDGRGEAARLRGHVAGRARSRAVRAPGLGVEGALRLTHRRAVQAAGRVVRLRARALHDGRRLRARGLQGLQGALRQGLHLPRQLHGELGSWFPERDLRPRGRAPRGRGHALLRRLPARIGGRPRHDRHSAARDDARRHRDRGEPERRALLSAHRAGTRCFRSSAGGCRSSPTTTSIPSSAPARSRSHRATIPTTSRSAAATTWRRSR